MNDTVNRDGACHHLSSVRIHRRTLKRGNSMSYSRRQFIQTTASVGAGALIAGCVPGASSISHRPQFDLLIKGGGSSTARCTAETLADVGIRDGRIIALGTIDSYRCCEGDRCERECMSFPVSWISTRTRIPRSFVCRRRTVNFVRE
jgi:hypothetical protein